MAHTGAGAGAGFSLGFVHPFGGVDHLLAMTAVGLWASYLGGRAIWAVPAAFVAMMTVGAASAMQGVPLPVIETGIALSVVVLGALIALRIQAPVAAGMAIAGVFALLHGRGHAMDMPANVSGWLYGLGFCAATVLLHAMGVAFGTFMRPSFMRWTGAAVSAAGFALWAAG